MQNLHITTVQTALHWEDNDANLAMFEELLATIQNPTDVIILPEMFTTGFTMNPKKVAETMTGKTMNWLKEQAKIYSAVVTGSLVIEEEGKYYNRLIWMRPDGSFGQYDKRHLFGMAGEQDYYAGGTEKLVTNYKGWKIMPLVCYDLRFPVWSRNTMDYDVLIYTANWPQRRSAAWKTLLEARAIENQAYVIGVNRVGKDGKDNYYSGDTSMIDAMGNVVYRMSDVADIHTHILSAENLKATRAKLPFLKDRD